MPELSVIAHTSGLAFLVDAADRRFLGNLLILEGLGHFFELGDMLHEDIHDIGIEM